MSKEINKEDQNDCCCHKKRSLIKFLPSTITITGFCCGLTSIRFALFQQWEFAVLSIFVAALLDAFDGRVARAIGQSSQIGAQLDSLSDLVCFGVAPAVVLFLRTMYLFEGAGWAVCMFFTVCCALRLARFNAQMLEPEEPSALEKRFFTGVPAPAGAIIALLPLTLYFETSKAGFLAPGFVAFCLLFSGVMMISTLRTFSSKMLHIDSSSALYCLIAIALCVICLITDIWLTLSLFAIVYIIAIPLGVFEYSKGKKASEEILETTVEDKIPESAESLLGKASDTDPVLIEKQTDTKENKDYQKENNPKK